MVCSRLVPLNESMVQYSVSSTCTSPPNCRRRTIKLYQNKLSHLREISVGESAARTVERIPVTMLILLEPAQTKLCWTGLAALPPPDLYVDTAAGAPGEGEVGLSLPEQEGRLDLPVHLETSMLRTKIV